MLSRETSALPGKWETSRVPFMRDVMDSVNDPETYMVVGMMASQISKTESLVLNVLGYYIDQDPSPIMIVEPRDHDAKKTSKSRIAPMIRDTPCLRRKVVEQKSRETGNTILEKSFVGGRLVLTGANSPAGLAGDPIRILLFNEVSRFPPSAGAEGDPVSIAEARTTTFFNRKIVMNSSPTDEAICRISKAYESSDQRKYYVPCVHCKHMQVLLWEHVKWDKDADGNALPDTALYHCEKCKESWTEAERRACIHKGEWRAGKPFDGIAGFWLNALYAPWPNLNLGTLAKRFLRVKGNPLQLKSFVNTVLAETWKEDYSTLEPGSIMSRLEDYPVKADGVLLVPKNVVVLTAGVDVQDDRIEVTVRGWGAGDESWTIAHEILYGDPSVKMVWNDLHGYLTREFEMERGGRWRER